MWRMKASAVFPLEAKYKPVLENLVPKDPMCLFHLKRGSPEEEFPDLARNRTCMAEVLTMGLYRRQFQRSTQSGVIFDDIIRPGLEAPESRSIGCLAGDGQSYILFCDFFDRIIEAFHKHKVTSNTPACDLNYNNLKGGVGLGSCYITSCEVSVVRGVEDFCFPSHCSRGERRQLLMLATTALQQLAEEFPGHLFSLEGKELQEMKELQEVNLLPPSPFQQRTGVARDWPDARAAWVSKDGSLVVWVNLDDHLKLVSKRQDADITEAFKTICINLTKLEALYKQLRHPFMWKHQLGWLSSSPADVGTGLRVSLQLQLQHVPRHPKFHTVLSKLRVHLDRTECSGVYRLSNAHTFGMTEVELAQLVVDAVKLLVVMEMTLAHHEGIEDLFPAQK